MLMSDLNPLKNLIRERLRLLSEIEERRGRLSRLKDDAIQHLIKSSDFSILSVDWKALEKQFTSITTSLE